MMCEWVICSVARSGGMCVCVCRGSWGRDSHRWLCATLRESLHNHNKQDAPHAEPRARHKLHTIFASAQTMRRSAAKMNIWERSARPRGGDEREGDEWGVCWFDDRFMRRDRRVRRGDLRHTNIYNMGNGWSIVINFGCAVWYSTIYIYIYGHRFKRSERYMDFAPNAGRCCRNVDKNLFVLIYEYIYYIFTT